MQKAVLCWRARVAEWRVVRWVASDNAFTAWLLFGVFFAIIGLPLIDGMLPGSWPFAVLAFVAITILLHEFNSRVARRTADRGTCFRCGQPIKAGKPIVRAKNGRVAHFGCTTGAIGDADALGSD